VVASLGDTAIGGLQALQTVARILERDPGLRLSKLPRAECLG